MQFIGNFLKHAEQTLFPERVREREYKVAHATADSNAITYLAQLPSVDEQIQVINLDEAGKSTIQVYDVRGSSQLVLIIPGFNSDGQSHKYNWLISDLNRQGISVVRANNQPKIDIRREEFDSYGDFTIAHQQVYLNFMKEHFLRINNFLHAHHLYESRERFHIIGSSAGGTAALALHQMFDVNVDSLLLLGPSEDIAFPNVEEGINSFLQNNNRHLSAIAGQYDGFRKEEPFLTLKQKAATKINLSVSTIPHAAHDLKDENIRVEIIDKEKKTARFIPIGGTIQLAIHREAFRAIGLSVQELDNLFGTFPSVKQEGKPRLYIES